MPNTIGSIIANGEPDVSGNAARDAGNSERIAEPEIINGFDAIEPDTEPIGATGSGEPRRTRTGKIDRRTRAGRAVAGESTTEKETPNSLGLVRIDLTSAIYGLHLTLAGFVPELELGKPEAEKLAKATTELGKYYAMEFDPKKVAWFNFCTALGAVYIPRVIAIKNRLRNEPQPVPISEAKQSIPINKPTSKTNGVAPIPDFFTQNGAFE
jgi:hypothetical protein